MKKNSDVSTSFRNTFKFNLFMEYLLPNFLDMPRYCGFDNLFSNLIVFK